jgi:hypothetical protein
VNWGESLYIQGGINAFQPIDAGVIVKPGSELKEAYQPDPMIDVQVTLPNNFAVEAFYKFGWNETTLPVAGTFFGSYSAADIIGPGQKFTPFGTDYAQAVGGVGSEAGAIAAGLLVRRQDDNRPDDQGQFGAKLGYYADWLNDGTDMGFYYTHFHGSLPYLDFTVTRPDSSNLTAQVVAGVAAPAAGAGATTLRGYCANLGFATFGTCAAGNGVKAALLSSAVNMRYLTNYASDIDSFGYSFNTVMAGVLNGTALSGELSWTPKNPLQMDVYSGILANNLAYAQADWFAVGAPDLGVTTQLTDGRAVNTTDGSIITPWLEKSTFNGQLGTVSTLPSTYPIASLIGSDLMILVGNAGFQYISDFDSKDRLSGAGSTANGSNGLVDLLLGQGKCIGNPGGTGNPFAECTGANHYFASQFSWGYRLSVAAQYNNAFGSAWTLTPSVVWSHDVKGVSAGPIGPGFVEGVKKVKVGLAGSYQNAWRVSVDWTTAFGGDFLRNPNTDKDYATATVSYAF